MFYFPNELVFVSLKIFFFFANSVDLLQCHIMQHFKLVNSLHCLQKYSFWSHQFYCLPLMCQSQQKLSAFLNC